MVADAELIRRVQTLVDELDTRRGIAARPAIALTDEPTSSARHGSRRRQPSIRISRAHAAGDPDILRGVVAHEYAHAIDGRAWRDIIVTLVGLFTAALVPFAVYTYAHLSGQHTWTSALVSPGLAVAACWLALISHRRELRADRAAAELLGDPRPVRAMIAQAQSRHAQFARYVRLLAWLSHPAPRRRDRALRKLPTTTPDAAT
jgi:Zn-dependent protease with chaperone function